MYRANRLTSAWIGISSTFLCLLSPLGGCKQPEQQSSEQQSTKIASGEVDQALRWFVDESKLRKLDHTYSSGHSGKMLFPEIVGGGGAALDFDGDGWMDLYLVQGGTLESDGSQQLRNRLFRNVDQGHFQDVSLGSGADHPGYAMGAIAADYDGDGWVDLYVTNVGPNVLLRNNGDGTFSDVTDQAGVGDPGWGTSAAFLDIDGDGRLDLYVANYVHWSRSGEIGCFQPNGRPDYCSPKSYDAPQADVLYRNNGDGTFTDVSALCGIDTAKGNGLGVVTGDFNNDGFVDIFVANDMTYNILWINDGHGKFTNQALNFGCAVDRDGQEKAGMGTCAVDLKGNGKLDLFVVNLAGQSDSFYENRGSFFADQTPQRGLAVDSRPLTRFGVGFHDFDRDGWLDIFIANGRVTLPDNLPASGDPFSEPNLLLRGKPDHRFERVKESEAGDVNQRGTSRAAIFADFDNDGSLEIVVINKDGPAELLVNSLPQLGNWIGFRVLDAKGNDSIGAVVTLETSSASMRRDVNPHYGYLASHDPRVLFGLGGDDRVNNVRVQWGSGQIQDFGSFSTGKYHLLQIEPH